MQLFADSVVGVLDVEAAGGDHQLRVERQPQLLQGADVALVAQLADGLVIGPGDQRRDAPVSVAVQLPHGLLGRLLVGDGHGGILALGQRAVTVGVGAAHEGNIQKRQVGGSIVELSAQENDTPQPFLTLHHRAALDLVIAGGDLLHHQGEARLGDGAFDGADDVGVKRVGHAAHHQADGIGLGADQVAGAVVGNVVAVLDGGQHLAPHVLADIGAVVQYTGNGADADAAELCYILDRHTPRFLSAELARWKHFRERFQVAKLSYQLLGEMSIA